MKLEKLKTINTAKNEYGICKMNNNILGFYKIKKDNIVEYNGYNLMKKYYTIPKMYYHMNDLLVYEYREELMTKTLHEYLYYDENEIDFERILKPYKFSYSKRKKINEDETVNKSFFKNRTSKYNFEELNNIIYETKKILNEPKYLTSFITQGDPTDTNISTNGIYTDFENAGYNSAIGEIAIMFASFITHGKYFYPKYNSKTYTLRNRILYDYENYKPDINNMKIPHKNVDLMERFLNIFEGIDDEINKYLKYYIIFRMISPINVEIMDDYDKEIIKNYILKIYNINMTKENLIKLIKEDELHESFLLTKTRFN